MRITEFTHARVRLEHDGRPDRADLGYIVDGTVHHPGGTDYRFPAPRETA
jgi:hypothetical protein